MENDVQFYNSIVYRAFQLERESILEHKWYMSERAGHDVGFDLALIDWLQHNKFKSVRQAQS